MSTRLDAILDMIEKDPSDPFLQYALALEYEKNDQVHRAVQILEHVKQKHPEYLAAYYKLGKLYELLLNNIAAIAVYNEGIVLARTNNDMKTLGELKEAVMNLED